MRSRRTTGAPQRALGWACLLATALACAAEPDAEALRAAPVAPRVRVSVGMHVIEAELAADADARARGLSGRAGLAPGAGMLFVYERPDHYGFWMQGMRFDLDLVWIRAARIVDIKAHVPHTPPPTGELPVHRPKEPADTVLEVAAGTAARLGWQVGDPVSVEPLEEPGS